MGIALSEASPKQLLDMLEQIADEMDKKKDGYGEATSAVEIRKMKREFQKLSQGGKG